MDFRFIPQPEMTGFGNAKGGHVSGRRFLLYAAAGAALVVGLIPQTAASAATSGDWATYLNGAGRTGFNGSETRITP